MRWDINFHICPRALKRVNERANKRMSEWLSCYFPIPSRSVPPPDASSFVWWFLSDPDDFVEFWFVDAGHRSRHCHARADASRTGASDRRGCHRRRPPAFRQRAGAKGNRTRWEASDEQWVERQRNQGVELIRSLVPSHSSLIRVLHNARFARALRSRAPLRFLARSLTFSLPSPWESGLCLWMECVDVILFLPIVGCAHIWSNLPSWKKKSLAVFVLLNLIKNNQI